MCILVHACMCMGAEEDAGGFALSFSSLFFNNRVCSSLVLVVLNIMTQINFGEETLFWFAGNSLSLREVRARPWEQELK